MWGREDALKQKPHQEEGAAEQPQPPAVSWVTESNGQETEKPPVGWQGKGSPARLVMGSSQQRGRWDGWGAPTHVQGQCPGSRVPLQGKLFTSNMAMSEQKAPTLSFPSDIPRT